MHFDLKLQNFEVPNLWKIGKKKPGLGLAGILIFLSGHNENNSNSKIVEREENKKIKYKK